ncbi:MAG: hypothetical protein JO131_06300, partial [Gammaproteobacteria bacterium]|nr:hypothetical protein [Gammaproteobacteria bacterium]
MKSFLVLLSEKQSDLLNESLLKDHISYLKILRKNGYLPMCGPFSDNQGALLILRANSKSHVEELISCDPFIKQNYYKKYKIHEFTEASDENNWLSHSDQTLKNIACEKSSKDFLNL